MNLPKKALVMVTTSFPRSGDGSEAAGGFVADLAETMAKHMPVRVVAPGTCNARETWCDGVEVFRFAAPEQPLSTLKPWRLSDLSTIRKVLAAGRAATRDAVRAGPTAHVLALWALPSGHWARQVWRETGVPYSVWTLGSDIWTLGRIPIVRTYIARVLRDAEKCYSDGLRLAEDTREIGRRRVTFLPSARNISSKRATPLRAAPPYRLLFLGRWHYNKGVDLLLGALDMLSNEDWERIEVVRICGGGGLEPLVRSSGDKLRKAGRTVEISGYLDKRAAENVMSRSDIVLIPSRIESIPVVFSDAMKLGCPVVSTPVGDLTVLLLDEKVGVLAREISSAGIAKAISEVLRKSLQRDFKAISSMALRFDLENIASRIISSLVTDKVSARVSAKRSDSVPDAGGSDDPG